MANGLYKLYKEACTVGAAHASYTRWGSDAIKFMFVTSAYTPNLTTDQFVGDGTSPIPTAAIVARSGNFSGKSEALGTVNASNVTVSSVSGSAIQAIVIYNDQSASDATDPLIAYIDTGTGLPVTPNGGDIIVAWDTGSNKIFTI